MQLTVDQQVGLSISGQDKYGNSVPIGGDTVWESSDEGVVRVDTDPGDPTRTTAVAVDVGTAAVTVTNNVGRDGAGDFIGSLAIDVITGRLAEIEIAVGAPTAQPGVNQAPAGPGAEETTPEPTPDRPVTAAEQLPDDDVDPDDTDPDDRP